MGISKGDLSLKVVGILGGGQLGLFLSQSLARLGAATAVFDPDLEAPTHRHTAAAFPYPFTDQEKLRQFEELSDVITYEFEHLPVSVLSTMAEHESLFRPSLKVLAVAQDRLMEKCFLRDKHFPVVDFLAIEKKEDLAAFEQFGLPCLVKTVRGGYDGKGQKRLKSEAERQSFLPELLARLERGETMVAEKLIDLSLEMSCIVARQKGRCVTMPVFENVHKDSILDTTVFPSSLSKELDAGVRKLACDIAAALDVEGLLTVEFFLSGQDIFVNELAPRPHNSGHLSMQAFNLSQFDLLSRILLDIPIADCEPISEQAFAMANILGDCYYRDGDRSTLNMKALEQAPGFVELLLYGKQEPRKARKMGHLVCRGATPAEALNRALALRKALSSPA